MRITKYFSVFLLSILFISSCSDESESDNSLEKDTKIESRQWTVDFTPFDPCVGPVSVYIEPCFVGTGYEAAIPEALDMVMDVSSVEFVLVSNPSADLVFQCINGGPACGQGGAWSPTNDGTIGYTHTAVHELLHTLGIKHNDSPGFNSVHVPGTPLGYEFGSVINSGPAENNSGLWCSPSCTLTENDILALDFLYPSCGDCADECPIIETNKIVDSDNCCQWRVEMQTNSQCNYFYDIRYPSYSTEGITIPNGLLAFETETVCCGGGSIIIMVYTLDANGVRQECETIELACCGPEPEPCHGCPAIATNKVDLGNGCCEWEVWLSNFSVCEFYYDINHPDPSSSSFGNVVPLGISDMVIVDPPPTFTTKSVCCKEGPVIINMYIIGPRGEKQYCEPIVLSCCKDDCQDREDCFEIGLKEGTDCMLQAFFEDCGFPSIGNAPLTWMTPSGSVPGGTTLKAYETGIYCLTVAFKEGCALTDCIYVEGCRDNGGASVGN